VVDASAVEMRTRAGSITIKIKLVGSGTRDINYPALNERPAIVDFNRRRMTIVEIFNQDLAAEWKRAMSSREATCRV